LTPAGSELVVKLAIPELSTAAVPKIADPEKNSTLPVGIPNEEVTAAVMVTACPTMLGLGVTDTAVAVDVDVELVTVCVVFPELAANAVLPRYEAVMT
jgi:hypothetical protein